jgi:hypothetical protein
MRAFAALCFVAMALGGCGSGPPQPPFNDAFAGLYNRSAATVPAEVPVRLSRPLGVILSDNVEAYVAWVKKSNEYWGRIVPTSLTNDVALADIDPNYIAAQVLAMLKRHFPEAQVVRDFNEAVSAGKKSVCLLDIRPVPGGPSFSTTKVDITAYFFDVSMNPVSKMSGHGEAVVPYPATSERIQPSTETAVGEIEAKINALVH